MLPDDSAVPEPVSAEGASPLVAVPAIQGAALTSPLTGERVATQGIVTAVDTNGFYLQDPEGDGDDATSDGIFVFTGGAPGVAVGDAVQVTGTVGEFIPGGPATGNLSTTQLGGSPEITVLSSDVPLPDPVVIGRDGRVPPDMVIDDDALQSYDPATDGLDFFESLEGMRVTVEDAAAVAPTNRFGEIFTVADKGKDATGLNDRGGITIAPDDFNPERVQIQSDSGILDVDLPQVATGATLGDVTGVVGYGFGNFEVLVTEDFTGGVKPGNLKPETTKLKAGEGGLTIASYNVLNLDPKVEDVSNVADQDPDEIDDDVGDGRFDRTPDSTSTSGGSSSRQTGSA